MWSLKEFKEHLQSIEMGTVWEEKIYRGLKNQILGVVLASFEGTSPTDNTFELSGADFMIGFDYEPIFLEVNSSPDLSFSTRVTEEICRRVMEDVLKGRVEYTWNSKWMTNSYIFDSYD